MKQPSILLAEDDQELRMLLAWILRQNGFRVTECSHGVDLLDHLGSSVLSEEPTEVFDLIVSDIRMPGVSGMTVLEGISRRRGFPAVILITAFGDEETHERAERLGAFAVLDKPFDTDQLLLRAREAVSPGRRAT